MAVHVRYKSWYISVPSSVKQQRELTKFCEHEPRQIVFKIYISNFMLCSIFSFEIAVIERNKLNDLRLSRDLLKKCSIIFQSTSSPASPS